MACFRCSKKKKQKDPPVDQIIQKLIATEGELIKQQEDLERQIEECVNAAKNFATTNRRLAMRALQKKKRLEKSLGQVDDTLTTLELQKEALENAKVNAAILGPMRAAGEILKKANIKLDNNKVQTIMDEISEQHSVGQDISTTIRTSLFSDIDEEELARELEEMQKPIKNKSSAGTSKLTKLPSVPKDLNNTSKDNQKVKNENGLIVRKKEDII